MSHFEPRTLRMLWRDEKSGSWRLTLRLELVEGRLECTRFGIEAMPGSPAGIKTTVLRKLPLARLVDQLRDEHIRGFEWLGAETQIWGAGGRSDEAGDIAALRAAIRTKPGRPVMYDDDHYRQVAAIYSAAEASRQPPAKAVADNLGVARTTAIKWVQRARERGFLPPTTRGKSAGSAGRRSDPQSEDES